MPSRALRISEALNNDDGNMLAHPAHGNMRGGSTPGKDIISSAINH